MAASSVSTGGSTAHTGETKNSAAANGSQRAYCAEVARTPKRRETMLSSNRKPTQPCTHGRGMANDRGLNQQGAEPQRGRWVRTMQGGIWQGDLMRCMRDGAQQGGGGGCEQKRRNRRQAGVMSGHGSAGAVLGTTWVRIHVLRGWRLGLRAHTHARTIARHDDVGGCRGQRTDIGRHGQLLKQEAKQHNPRP